MWRHLLLEPYAVQTSPASESGAQDTVTVCIRHHESFKQAKPALHKLGNDVPFHDVRPPPGISTLVLESVHLVLSFSRLGKRKRRKLNHSNYDAVTSDLSIDSSTGLHVPVSDDELLDAGVEDDVQTALERGQDACLVEFDDWLLDEADEDILLEGAERDSEMREQMTPSQNECVQSPGNLKRSPNASETPGRRDVELGIEDAMLLVDVAMRLAICSPPSRIDKGVRVTRQDSFTRLADIAPSLWAPGYLPAVSSRAVFLPTISHALMTVGGKRCKNPSLHSKLTELARQSRTTGLEGDGKTSLEQCLSIRLWRVLQQGCYDPVSAARLKVLRSGKDLPLSCGDDNDLLLDSSQDQPFNADPGPYEADQQEDLFSPEESDCEESLLDTFDLGDLPLSATVRVLHRSFEDPIKQGGGQLQLNSSSLREMHLLDLEDCENEHDEEDDILSICSSIDSVLFPVEDNR